MADAFESNRQVLVQFYEKVASENLPKTPLFKAKLSAYMEEQKKKISFLNVPWIVRKCCDYLTPVSCLKTEGIFRVPGSHTTIKKLSDMFDQGQNPDFEKVGAYVEDVSGLLKKYLRDLPDLPLLSDGTPEDPLQKSIKETMSLSEDEQVKRLSELLRKLPVYKKQLVYDLFTLLSRVSYYADVNLMDSQNLATIFGGMGDIITSMLNATERTDLCRLMIDHYDELFENFVELKPPIDDGSLDNVKEAIRIYLADGTFKAMFCQGNETAKVIIQRTVAKLQQQLDLDTSAFQLWEVRDGFCRRISDDEKLLAIHKAQSAIVFTDKLKDVPPVRLDRKKKDATRDRSQSVSSDKSFASPEPSKDQRKGTSKKKDKHSKPTPESKGRSTRSDSVQAKPPREKREKKQTSTTTSAPAAAATSSTGPDASAAAPSTAATAQGEAPSPDVFFAWVFPEIPPGSSRASGWDTENTFEGELHVHDTGFVTVISEAVSGEFNGANIRKVEDSSRFYVLSSPQATIGIGFDSRDESVRFRTAVLSKIRLDTSQAYVSAAQRYFMGPLPPNVTIEDGFYDVGPQRELGEMLPSLDELKSKPVDLGAREVILVDAVEDARLARLIEVAQDLVKYSTSLQERVKTVAMFVANVMGGTDISAGFCALENEQEHETTLELLSNKCIDNLRKKNNSNVVKLGSITHGVSRHRALLFKVICDRLNPPIATALLRSDSNKHEGDITWNYVAAFEPLRYIYVDLMHDPGRLYHATAEEIAHLSMILHGAPLSFDCSARSVLSAPEVANFEIQEKAIFPANTSNTEMEVKVYEAVGSSKSSFVYRGSLGPYTIAVKQVIRPTVSDAVNLADLAEQRSKLVHRNIARSFGYMASNEHLRLLNEYLGKQSLGELTRDRKLWQHHFPEEQIWYYIHEIAAGLAYLHSSGVIHGNLKNTNILLDGRAEPYTVVKLTDIMIRPAYVLLHMEDEHIRWFAPEVLSGQPVDSINWEAADIWSLGMLILNMATLRKPYAGMQSEERKAAIQEGVLPSYLDDESPFAGIIQQCCAKDPSARPTAADIVAVAAQQLTGTALESLIS